MKHFLSGTYILILQKSDVLAKTIVISDAKSQMSEQDVNLNEFI